MITDRTPLPELSEINKAQLWLHYFHVLNDQGVPLKIAVRRTDEFFGFGRTGE